MHTLTLKKKIRKQKIRILKTYFGPEAGILGLALSLMIVLGIMVSNNTIPTEKIFLVVLVNGFAILAAFVALASGIYSLHGFMTVWGALNAIEKDVNK